MISYLNDMANYFGAQIALSAIGLMAVAFSREKINSASYFLMITCIVITLIAWGSWGAITGENYYGASRVRTILTAVLIICVAAGCWIVLTELIRKYSKIGFIKNILFLVASVLITLFFPVWALIIGCYVGHSCP